MTSTLQQVAQRARSLKGFDLEEFLDHCEDGEIQVGVLPSHSVPGGALLGAMAAEGERRIVRVLLLPHVRPPQRELCLKQCLQPCKSQQRMQLHAPYIQQIFQHHSAHAQT